MNSKLTTRKDFCALGDRMKLYEQVESGRRLLPLLPVLARIDGRCFSSFTRGLARPYDERLSRLMVETCRFLVDETNAAVGYVQSDEISLAWHSKRIDSAIFFDGRVLKMTSQLAALATAFFNRHLSTFLPEKANTLPTFDARVWNVPNLEEAANCFLWREQDATRNSISMAAQAHFSHGQLQGKHTGDMQEMLWSVGVNWNDYPSFFKRGVFVQRRTVLRAFTTREIEQLPPRHEARSNPDLQVARTEWVQLDMPPFGEVVNRVDVLFDGATPCRRSHVSTPTNSSDESMPPCSEMAGSRPDSFAI